MTHAKKLQQQKREYQILLSLAKLDYLTTEQIMILHDLKSDRNARRVLQNMGDKLHVRRFGQNVYYLNQKGRDMVGCKVIRKATGNIDHFLIRNSVYIAEKRPFTWKNEVPLRDIDKRGKEFVVTVADAYFERDGIPYLIEVDNTQSMTMNARKIAKYKKFVDEGKFKTKPRFIWATSTEARRVRLKNLHSGLAVKIYLHEDLI